MPIARSCSQQTYSNRSPLFCLFWICEHRQDRQTDACRPYCRTRIARVRSAPDTRPATPALRPSSSVQFPRQSSCPVNVITYTLRRHQSSFSLVSRLYISLAFILTPFFPRNLIWFICVSRLNKFKASN